MKVAQSTESTTDAVLFCTHAPCIECAKLIYQSGIRQVYFSQAYRDNTGIEFLKKSGIEVTQV
jgi:dCMP deaminase